MQHSKARVVSNDDDDDDDETSVALWSYAAALLLFLLAAVLILAPRLLLFFSEDQGLKDPRIVLSPLETFLARCLGIWLAAISLTLILNISSYSPPVRSSSLQGTSHQPLLWPVTIAANVTGILAWNTKQVGSLGTLIPIISGSIGLWGLWAVVFGDARDKSRCSSA
ncbi:hypothetical protein AX15_005195 [Amanita polypyramis BW_CC]|nr:hypothetical protein AX15_005195 [Amanita polypyramis BW_CC]